MTTTASTSRALRRAPVLGAVFLSGTLVLAGGMFTSAGAATPTTINLATAGAASVLAGAGVTNSGPSLLNLDLDTAPTPAITGFPPGQVLGTTHRNDGVAQQAQSDLTTAYNAAASAPSTGSVTGVDLGGKTLTQGVYTASSSMSLTGPRPLTLNGGPDSVFIFQAGSTLITGPNSSVLLTGGATECNVFWQVGSSATLDTNTAFKGNILALTSISLNTGAKVQGRALARNGSVTLLSNVFSGAACTAGSSTIPTAPSPVPTPGTPGSGTPVGTPVFGFPTPVARTPVTPTPVAATPVTPTPVVATPVTPTPVAKTPVVATPVTPTPGGGLGGGGPTLIGSPPGPTGTLPITGLSVVPLIAAASLLVLAGAGLLVLAHRRRHHQAG